MAEQKNSRKTSAKTTAKTSAEKKTSQGNQGVKKETTKVTAQPTRFGDSILDEILLILVIVLSVVVFISVLTEKMGVIGHLFRSLFQGLFGFGAILAPLLVVFYCIWMLFSEERKFPLIRAFGGVLFLLTVSAAAYLINPVKSAEGLGFLKRCGALYAEGAFYNGGLFGGLLGGALYHALDVLGSTIVLLALFVISVIMGTGKSFFYAIGDYAAHRKAKQKVKNEKIKNRAERIRQQELLEEERLAKREERHKKSMAREDFNIELKNGQNEDAAPYVEETVFRKKPLHLDSKKKEPIYDYQKEAEQPMEEEPFGAEPIVSENIPAEPVIWNGAEPMEDESMEDVDVIEEIFAQKEEPSFIEEMPEAEVPLPVEEESVMPQKAAEEPGTTEETPLPKEPEEEIPYVFPPISLLGKERGGNGGGSRAEMLANAKKLETTLKSFGVDAKVVQISKGPTVTRYELSPSQGVKVSKIVNLADDIALNLAASGIRIEAPIPGKAAVGIEVPNQESQSVYLRTVLESDAFQQHPSKLAFALGEDIAGNPVVTDIAKMPHLLIAGATGSGKSVCINTLITSILYKADPKEVKLLLVDPKVVELSVYNGIPHLLIPVVTDPKKASAALNWAVREMLQRYNDFAAQGVRDIKGFNKMMEEKGEEKGKMPQIVIIIDELADLMMAAPGEVEDAICRLAQMARAAGMHLIIATQRPSVDVITGVIKANIPSRLAFAVSSGIDSRTILDMVGAEKLLGKGDMLFYPSGQSKPSRLQGAFVTDEEVEAIVDFLRKSGRPGYNQETIDRITSAVKVGGGTEEEFDEFFEQAVDLILEKEKASVSMLQRQFRIGYNRAARLMDELERRGIVGPEEGSKPRKVLISRAQWEDANGDGAEEI